MLHVLAPLLAAWLAFRVLRRYLRDPGRVKGRAVVVTGCDVGIGRAVALKFHELGAIVFAGCLTESAAKELSKEGLRGLVLDVTKEKDVEAARAAVGDIPVQAVVLNAGISAFGWAEVLPIDRYKQNMEVNYLGAVRVAQAFLPHVRQTRGRVVFMGSIGARMPSAFGAAYLSTKAAMVSFAECLRQEVFRFGVRVCVVEPGFFASELLTRASASGKGESTDRPGASAYPPFAEKMAATAAPIQMIERLNGSIDVVVDATVDAAVSRMPLTRYTVGYDARLLRHVVCYVPDWIIDWAQTFA